MRLWWLPFPFLSPTPRSGGWGKWTLLRDHLLRGAGPLLRSLLQIQAGKCVRMIGPV